MPLTYLTIERIFTTVADTFGLSVRTLLSHNKGGIRYKKYRWLCSYALWKQGAISQKEAADMLGITQSAFQYNIALYRGYITKDAQFADRCKDILDNY